MTKEQENLILKDICARIPYGLFVYYNDYDDYYPVKGIRKAPLGYFELELDAVESSIYCSIDEVKLCLLPMSNITEDQKYDFYCRFIENDCDFDDFKEFYLDDRWHKLHTSLDDIDAIIDWFYKNHIDFRGLIPNKLAKDVTNLNVLC